jgi:hypothetical protein
MNNYYFYYNFNEINSENSYFMKDSSFFMIMNSDKVNKKVEEVVGMNKKEVDGVVVEIFDWDMDDKSVENV